MVLSVVLVASSLSCLVVSIDFLMVLVSLLLILRSSTGLNVALALGSRRGSTSQFIETSLVFPYEHLFAPSGNDAVARFVQ